MKTKRVNRTYSQEFKQEAVALVVEQGYSVAEAGRSLGVNANCSGQAKVDTLFLQFSYSTGLMSPLVV